MSMLMDEEIKRWTSKRKSALVLEIIQDKATVAEASRSYCSFISIPKNGHHLLFAETTVAHRLVLIPKGPSLQELLVQKSRSGQEHLVSRYLT